MPSSIHLEWRLLDPAARLTTMMDQLLERCEEWNERRRGHIAELRKRAAEAEAKLKRLYEAIENGVADAADPSLKNRVAELTAVRDQAQAHPERVTSAVERLGLRSRRTVCGGSRSPLDASCGTKMEPIGGTICVRSRNLSRSSTRANFASSARKPNCYGHLSPPRV